MIHLVAPSILSADFAYLKDNIEMINNSEADWFHVDVMDGVFVPNISFGFPVIKSLKKHAQKPLDVHLMIVEPDKYISRFKEAGADVLTVHYEATPHLHRTIQSIKAAGMQAGVSLNPHTSVHLLDDIIKELDLVLIMSVNPGFGGQSFIENTYQKIITLNKMITDSNSLAVIEVDGGVDTSNARKLINAGVNILVAGSFIFNSNHPKQTIKELKNV